MTPPKGSSSSSKRKTTTPKSSGVKKTTSSASNGKRAPPNLEKFMKPAIGVGLALLVYQFFQGLTSDIPRIDPTDEGTLRDVLFGENNGSGGSNDVKTTTTTKTKKNYVVLCHGEEDNVPISSVVMDAHNDNSVPPNVEFRLLDCSAVLPSSQKTIYERFHLNARQRPTVFVSGPTVGPTPKQIPSKHLKTGRMLVTLLKNMLEPRATKIETTQELRTKCLSKDICALLLKGTKTVSSKQLKHAITTLVEQHPTVTFASVDASNLYVKNLEEYLPEFELGVHRFVVFRKVSGGLETKDDRLVTSIVTLDDDTKLDYDTMNALVQSVINKTTTMSQIPSLPVLKTRTKKLEEEERAKRQRKREQQQRSSSSTTSTPGGQFTPNDGSREGRRAERERRRQEHYKQHNVQPKTPEEIREMERKRRIRMEEEAERWNMDVHDNYDAPDQGGGTNMGQDDDEGMVEEEYMDVNNHDVAGNDDDDEEILDLD